MIEMKSRAQAALALGVIALGSCHTEERLDGISSLQKGEVLTVHDLDREAFVKPIAVARALGGAAYESWEHLSFTDQHGRSVGLSVGPLEISGYVALPNTWKGSPYAS